MTTQLEKDAKAAAMDASMAIQKAINAYQAADYGSHVTDPLREALQKVIWSIFEVDQ